MQAGVALLTDHVARFNAGVRGGDFGPMVDGFTEDAELVFEGIPVGPFRGREAIAAAYQMQRPTTRSSCWMLSRTVKGGWSRPTPGASVPASGQEHSSCYRGKSGSLAWRSTTVTTVGLRPASRIGCAGSAGRGRPEAARWAGLEFVEKVLTRSSPARTGRSRTQRMLRRVPHRRIGRVGYRLRLTSHTAAWRGEVNRSRCAWASSGRANNSAISACRAACVLAAQPTGWWGAHHRHGGSVAVCAPSARRVDQSRTERARTRSCTTQRG